MKPYVINRNSWHYKMVSKGQRWDVLEYRVPKDFCSYWRMVVGKLLGYAFITSGFVFFLTWIGMALYINPIPTLIALGIIIGVICGSFGIAMWLEKRKEHKRQHDYDVKFNDKQESLLKMKYRAWKENVCPMVEYK
jgi:hypothetical protein